MIDFSDDYLKFETGRIGLSGSRLHETAERRPWFLAIPFVPFSAADVHDLCGTHNPVDITRITFGDPRGDLIAAEFDLFFDFSQENSDLSDRSATLRRE